jgi:hypothetical protein
MDEATSTGAGHMAGQLAVPQAGSAPGWQWWRLHEDMLHSNGQLRVSSTLTSCLEMSPKQR